MEKMTIKTQEILSNAITMAVEKNNSEIEDAHIFAALLADDSSFPSLVLNEMGINILVLKQQIYASLETLPVLKEKQDNQPHLSRSASLVLAQAEKEMMSMGDSYLSVEHLLLGMLASTGSVQKICKDNGLEKDKLYETIMRLRGGRKVDTENPEENSGGLDEFATDLTALARDGKIDPVIGRDAEIRRIIQVLSRRTKNNPVLIGAPGVGKTAVIEGLAQRIVDGDVPVSLQGKRLVQLDLSAIVAGTRYRGDFEERLKNVLQEIVDAQGDVITFIDEIHTLVSAGQNSDMDASNMLKPMLARGQLHMIGATTLDEYREIEKDPALERRFQQVYVGEPSVEDTVTILRGIAPKYEAHHKVTITDDALVAAAQLSHRYISDRQLPDKAIDLIDEAASRLRMELDSSPEEIDVLKRRVDRLKMEESYLSEGNTGDDAAMERLEKIRSELAEHQEELSLLNARWEKEKGEKNRVGDLRVKLDELCTEVELAVRDGRYDDAGRIQNGDIPAIEAEIERIIQAEKEQPVSNEEPMIAPHVDAHGVAEVVSAWTGVPVGRLLQGEAQRLLDMENVIARRLIGQEKAVQSVSDAVRRNRAGLTPGKRPVGSFLFLGPSGVGKTELAKSLADFLFDDENAMVRIDMSEYSDKHLVTRLVGSAPGYVGYEEGGQLTEAVRRRPYSVVLFDEVEKADEAVFDVLLQVLDDGRLTDGQGRTVDFTKTIIIFTSNLGASALVEPGLEKNVREESVMSAVRSYFKPEFLNRLDDMIIFDPLNMDDMEKIVDIRIGALVRIVEEKRISLEVSSQARAWLANYGYDPAFGARPLNRLIQKEITDRLARMLLLGDVGNDSRIYVDVEPDERHLRAHV